MTLFILTSNGRIPYHQPIRTPLVLKSIHKLKEQAQRTSFPKGSKINKEMKEKQFCSLEISIARLKPPVKSAMNSKQMCQTGLIDKMTFPEDLDDSFNHGLLNGIVTGSDNSHVDMEFKGKYQGIGKENTIPSIPKTQLSAPVQVLEMSSMNNNVTTKYKLWGPCIVPETPLLGALSRPMVPETPMLDASTECMQETMTMQSLINKVVTKSNVLGKQGYCGAGVLAKIHTQVVPETPFLKQTSSDDISLYE